MGNLTFFSVILGLIASLFAVGATVVLVLRYLHQRNTVDGGEEPPLWRLIVEAGTVIAIILIVALVINSLAAANNGVGPTPTATLASGGNGSTNIGAGIPPTTTETATQGTIALPTDTSAPVPTGSPDTTYGNQNIAPNWQLDCGGCDQPVIITVSLVTTNASNQNMVWTLTFKNHTADNMQVYFGSLGLIDQADPNDHTHNATGEAVKGPGISIVSGKTAQLQATFAFLPKHQEVYTLKAGLEFYDETTGGGYNYRAYGPQSITFP